MSLPALFRECHRLLTFVHDLEESLARIPRQRKAQQARVARSEQAIKEENEAIKRLRVLAAEKEGSRRDFADKLVKYEAQKSSAASVKQFDALKVQISHATDQSAKLDGEIKAASAESDQRAERVLSLEEALVTIREEVAAFEKGVAPREADWNTQLTKARADLAAAEAMIPADHRGVYLRIKSVKGHDTFAAVKGRNCTACNTEISFNTRTALLDGAFLTCKSCGRVQFLVEEPAKEADAAADEA